MTRISVSTSAAVAVAAAIAIAAGAVAAQGAAPDRQHHARIDANGDGVVDRTEAASHPRLAQQFDKLDLNADGRLAADELAQWKGKRGKGGHGGMRGGMHGGIARLDADGDGRISRAEVAGKARLADKFDEIDANRDGYIVRAEMQAWHERMRPQREAARAERFAKMFAEADLNGDGRLSRVEVAEKLPRLAARFAWLDGNRDGFLDREEMRSGKRR